GNTENCKRRIYSPPVGARILVREVDLLETRRQGRRRSQWVVLRIPGLCCSGDIHTTSSLLSRARPLPPYCQQLTRGFSAATASAAAKPAAGVNSRSDHLISD